MKKEISLIQKKLIISVIVTTVLLLAAYLIPIGYYVAMPSRTVDLRDIITVEDAANENGGSFYLVTVNQQRASPLTFLYGYFHPYMDISRRDSVIPKGMSESEYRQLLNANMLESQHLAQVVALRRLRFEVDIISEGVEIIDFLDQAPASGFLQKRDKITFIDSNPVFLASEVPIMVQDRPVGSEVNLIIIRGSEIIELSVPTGPSPDDPEIPYLGIFIKTLPWEPVLPLNIAIDAGKIGGPSAGLVFVLEILNQFLKEDIAAGRKIAGTGTIDLNENIGRVGGVTQKVISAERAGAEIFFVPEGNYEQAQKAATKVKVVPVANLEEALLFLESLEKR